MDLDFISNIIIPPYGHRLLIATPLSEEDIQEMEDKWSLLNEDKQLGGFHIVNHEGWNSFLIIFNLSHNQSISYGMLAHEALHVVDSLFDRIGHNYDYENNEPAAYLIEWIVNEIIKHFIEKKLINTLSYESVLKQNFEEDETLY